MDAFSTDVLPSSSSFAKPPTDKFCLLEALSQSKPKQRKPVDDPNIHKGYNNAYFQGKAPEPLWSIIVDTLTLQEIDPMAEKSKAALSTVSWSHSQSVDTTPDGFQ